MVIGMARIECAVVDLAYSNLFIESRVEADTEEGNKRKEIYNY